MNAKIAFYYYLILVVYSKFNTKYIFFSKNKIIFSPAFYWIFNYIFDIISSIIWFCYILAIYCIFDVAFNGSPNSRTSSSATLFEFATSWDFRVQFYPLSIIIALPTLPFAYLITKIFKSDILVCINLIIIIYLI